MTKWGVLTLLTWAIALVLMVVGVVSYSEVRAELSEKRELSARLSSQLGAFENLNRELSQHLEANSQELERIDQFCARKDEYRQNGLDHMCNHLVVRLNPQFGQLLVLEAKATAARGLNDLEESVAAYHQASEFYSENQAGIGDPPAEAAWRQMGHLEGKAYGQFRLGNLADAQSLIANALDLVDVESRAVSGLVYSTDLKIRCASDDADDSEISELRDSYRGHLNQAKLLAEEAVSLSSEEGEELNYEQWLDYRRRDLDLFDSDLEIDFYCS